MRVKESALRLKRFEVEEKSQKVKDLEQMINEFDQMVVDLGKQIEAEEERTGIRDRAHFAYSTFARSAFQRRENLNTSINDLRAQLDVAITQRDDAVAELAQADSVNTREAAKHEENSPQAN